MSSVYIREEAVLAYPYLTPTGHDYMAWAKRIMFREQRKDATLLPIQVQLAKHALGIKDPEKK